MRTPCIRVLLALIFLLAGSVKAFDPIAFYQDIESYQILPYGAAVVMAYYLPYVEILCAFGLFHSQTRKEAAGILSCLTGLFMLAILWAWVRGLDIRCGCFGGSSPRSEYEVLLLRDFVILVAAVFWARSPKQCAPKREFGL